MLAFDKVRRAVRDPLAAGYAIRGKLDRDTLFKRYASRARAAGLDRVYFVLSFDCDTEDDIAVVWDVHSRLADMGVQPVYAVAGDLLRTGEKVYGRIRETGAQFINHGNRKHTYFDDALGRHASCFFYDEEPREDIRNDIMGGDETLRAVLDVEPIGFRTPHFGTFQRREQLVFLHNVLKELGYRFSTSTVPLYGFRHGAIFDTYGFPEIPVSGCATAPLRILDTWSCFMAPGRTLSPADYRREGKAMSQRLGALGAGILNYYADPIHIHDQPIFFETVKAWAEAAQSADYQQIMDALA